MKIEDLSADIGHLDPDRVRKTLQADSTVVARIGDPAMAVMSKVRPGSKALIIVVDKQERPVRIIDPDYVLHQLREIKGIRTRRLDTALRRFQEDPDEIARSFRHEWLNEIQVAPYWCEAGQHFVSRPPCPEH